MEDKEVIQNQETQIMEFITEIEILKKYIKEMENKLSEISLHAEDIKYIADR